MPATLASRKDVPHAHPPTVTLRELDKLRLDNLLAMLQEKLYERRHKKTTLVVHDGVVMVLGGYRRSTSGVYYIGSTLPEELGTFGKEGFMSSLGRAVGVTKDTRKILKECIAETAKEFNVINEKRYGYHLQRDWMDVDKTLPLTLQDKILSTLVKAAMKCEKEGAVIFDSPGLRLVAIPLSWTCALKLKSFTPEDKEDLIEIIRKANAHTRYDEVRLEDMIIMQLKKDCPQMEYDKLPECDWRIWSQRICECVRKATSS